MHSTLLKMNIIKKIPLAYQGELHDVKLIQFSVEKEELETLFPHHFPLKLWNQRALISMVNVQLKNMRPSMAPKQLGFSYQHVAFRLCLDDAGLEGAPSARGIYFLRSFAQSKTLCALGSCMTDYQLTPATISDEDYLFELKQGDRFLHYAIENSPPKQRNEQLKNRIEAIDCAYSYRSSSWWRTQIERKEWPLEWANAYHFETNFFESAQLEGAFTIEKPIDYRWNAPVQVRPTVALPKQDEPMWAI